MPWRIYDVSLPDVFNSLRTLEYGQGYWINVKDDVIWSVGGKAAARPDAPAGFGYPPTTFYGRVGGDASLTPAAGMTVSASINDQPCGQGDTVEHAGAIWYSIQVFADEPEAHGCDADGRSVTFAVNGRAMIQAAAWSNTQVWRLDLNSHQRIYLPVILR